MPATQGNTLMFQKLSEIYTSRRPRSILNPGGVYQMVSITRFLVAE